jgi:hypothetical protein
MSNFRLVRKEIEEIHKIPVISDNNKYQHIFYSLDLLIYEKFYQYDKNDDCEDCSYIIYFDNKIVGYGFAFLLTEKNKNKSLITYHGKLLPPIFITKLAHKSEIKLINLVYEYLENIGKLNQTKNLVFNTPFTGGLNASNFQKFIIKKTHSSNLSCELSVDLKKDEQLIYKQIKDSYKSLINKLTEYSTELVSFEDSPQKFENFKNFHYSVSGVRTRSEKTWNQQYKNYLNGRLKCIQTIFEDELIAFSYWDHNAYMALYSVGVYDRNKKGFNLGHSHLWTAIKYFKQIGLFNT